MVAGAPAKVADEGLNDRPIHSFTVHSLNRFPVGARCYAGPRRHSGARHGAVPRPPLASGIDEYTCSSNTLRSMPALAQGIMGTQKERSRPRVWGTEGFPEEVRLEPKLKRGYELTSPPLSEGSQ